MAYKVQTLKISIFTMKAYDTELYLITKVF